MDDKMESMDNRYNDTGLLIKLFKRNRTVYLNYYHKLLHILYTREYIGCSVIYVYIRSYMSYI
jgi:hypothetical protein